MRTKSCLKWSNICMEKNVWNFTRISTRTTLVFNVQKWSSWWNSLCKIFADDTYLFSKVHEIRKSPSELNDDLEKISHWAYQWNPKKQANEVIFSRKTFSNNLSHPPIKFNNTDISKCPHQKLLGIVLDPKLNFNAHVDQKIKKCNRIIDDSQSLFLEMLYLQYINLL